jgi:hypothetical protein
MSAHGKNRNINLLIKEENKLFSEQLFSWALTYGRYIVIITQIIVLSVFFARFKLDQEHTEFKELVSQKQAIVASAQDSEKEFRRIQKLISHISLITDDQDYTLKILSFFQNNTPSHIAFLSLSISSEKISFIATAENLRDFSLLLSKLQQNNAFSEIALENITRQADNRIEFNIGAKIDKNRLAEK